MDPLVVNLIVEYGALLLVAFGARAYLHRLRIERPPIGVFNTRDVCVTVVLLTAIPVLYLHLPTAVLAGVLTLFGFALIYQTLAPLAGRGIRVVVALALCGAEVGLVVSGHAGTPAFHAVNDVAMALFTVGISNVWAQSGIRARAVALFAIVVAGYDLLATGLSSTTLDLAQRLSGLPFAPLLGWGTGPNAAFSGLGDLLFVVLWPLVAEKAFSAAAGRAALLVTIGSTTVIAALTLTGVLSGTIPTMVLVGPAIAAHWWWLRRRHPRERTAGEFDASRLADTPGVVRPVRPEGDLVAATAVLAGAPSGGYHAVHDGAVLASGDDAALVLQEAARLVPDAVPVLVFAGG